MTLRAIEQQAGHFLVALTSSNGLMYAGIVGVCVLLMLMLRRHILVFSLVALPGTLLHEVSHVVMGLLSFGRPTGISLIPRRSVSGYVLGSARFANVRWYNGCFIGLSPLFMLAAAAWLLGWRITSQPAFHVEELLWVYFIASLAYGGIPSWQDIKVAATSFWLFVLCALAFWILTSEGFRVATLNQ